MADTDLDELERRIRDGFGTWEDDPAVKIANEAVTELIALARKVDEYERALREIGDPISFMRQRAKAEGSQINGDIAIQLSNDANFLKAIAGAALDKFKEK